MHEFEELIMWLDNETHKVSSQRKGAASKQKIAN